MSAKRHSVRVTILNEEYSIRSDTPPEHTRAVAQYVDQAIRHVMNSGLVVESGRAAILAAMQIAGELFEARSVSEELTNSIRSLSEEIRPLLPPGKRDPSNPGGKRKTENGEDGDRPGAAP